MKDLNCPYCNADLYVDHDGGNGYDESEVHQMQCSECTKYFTFTTSISYYYEPEKADCLNDKDHDWMPTSTTPKCFANMRCLMCQDEREPTEDEKIKYEIPSKESYFESIK